MAAYAALVSLMHTIDDLESHHSPPISLDKHQLQSLTESATSLQGFLEGCIYSSSSVDDEEEADPLEMRIAEAAHAAQDLIDFYIADEQQLELPSADAMTPMSSFTTTTTAAAAAARAPSAALVSELLAALQGFLARNPSEDTAGGIVMPSNIVDAVQMVTGQPSADDQQQVVFTFLESYLLKLLCYPYFSLLLLRG